MTDNRWPDPLDSDIAKAMKGKALDPEAFPASFLLSIYDQFDKMQREIEVHRKTFCESSRYDTR